MPHSYTQLGQGQRGASRAVDSALCAPTCDRLVERMLMSWPAARSRSAPTVDSSRGLTLNGSKLNSRIAFRWVMRSMSWSETPSSCLARVSGAVGHVESEWGESHSQQH